MPLDATNEWERKKVVTQDEIISVISAQYPLEILPARGAAPADRWTFVDGKGTVGVIPSVSHPFCADCDRVRLTSDGQFRTCLFATDEFDIRALLRNGGTDDEIAELMRKGVGLKWAGHQINQVNFIRPRRSMSQIGG
jgi:cyclic pyranopterin phosphate synthase